MLYDLSILNILILTCEGPPDNWSVNISVMKSYAEDQRLVDIAACREGGKVLQRSMEPTVNAFCHLAGRKLL